jgi:DNA-directed RNA polymerase subunit RPC12/RpoP
MLELCDIFKITVNELLIGEKINIDNSSQKNDELLLNMSNELEIKNKLIWNSMWALMTVSIVALLAGILIAALLIPEGVWQLVTILVACVFFMIPCFYALKLEVSVGAYKCKKCGEETVPTYREALNAMHKGTTRYLMCPRCGKKTWHKKVVKKD